MITNHQHVLWQARSIFNTPSSDVDSITAKTPSHSRITILYPFSSDYILRERYRNPWNIICAGKLLEDPDALAVGAVTWVGRSSMEIQLEVLQSTEETSDLVDSQALVANFTFVAPDSKTGKSA
ncbi:unnamed protein product [Lactuca saligna]|uniref:Uncharacterized protein n=1 Tax=Lactuca saligna TaxID=75948 RepID=A0AA35ZNL8_LACSI|nr:unnamed protein product [Lactuca saligna]